MSTMTAGSAARALPRPRPVPRQSAPRPAAYLRLVAARRSRAARAPFIAVVVLILGAGLLGLLVLNTVLAQDAFRLHALQLQGRALADSEQALQRQVSDLQSPQTLAARAAALGMVPGGPPAFLRLSDGKVLGQAIAAPAGPAVAPTVAPTVAALQTPVTPTAPAPATARAATVPAKASTQVTTQVTTPVAPAVKAPPGLSAGSTWTLVTGGTP
jgi:cell division protein FtsB